MNFETTKISSSDVDQELSNEDSNDESFRSPSAKLEQRINYPVREENGQRKIGPPPGIFSLICNYSSFRSEFIVTMNVWTQVTLLFLQIKIFTHTKKKKDCK